MSDFIPQELPAPAIEKLDDETERRLDELLLAWHTTEGDAEQSLNGLRSRVRELEADAWNRGVRAGISLTEIVLPFPPPSETDHD